VSWSHPEGALAAGGQSNRRWLQTLSRDAVIGAMRLPWRSGCSRRTSRHMASMALVLAAAWPAGVWQVLRVDSQINLLCPKRGTDALASVPSRRQRYGHGSAEEGLALVPEREGGARPAYGKQTQHAQIPGLAVVA